jgi:predicted glycoside hydrolase/deacetylase ChbG (UPF0249 family)
MNLIVNADDFGATEDTVLSTIYAANCGFITSATIMPNMIFTEEACRYAKNNPNISFGVHLTFVRDSVDSGERCISRPEEVKSLVDKNGFFLNSNSIRIKSLAKFLSLQDICAEMDAQLSRISDLGVKISHVDSHGHLHKFPIFLEALKIVLPRHSINKVRRSQNLYFGNKLLRPTYLLGKFYENLLISNFETTDVLYLPVENDLRAGYCAVFDKIFPRDADHIMEIGIHPGSSDKWRANELDFCASLSSSRNKYNLNYINWHNVN